MNTSDLCSINGNQYYNIILSNNTNNYIEADFNETRNTPILNGMQNYQGCVAYFRIDLQNSLPLFIWENGAYWIGMEFNGASVDVPLSYDPQLRDISPSPKLNNIQIYDYVYNMQTLINMMNTAFTACYIGLGGAHNAPFCYLDNLTNKINIVVDKSDDYYPNGADPARWKIYLNNKLYSFCSSLPAVNLNPPTDIANNATTRNYLIKVYLSLPNTYPANKLFESVTYDSIVVRSTNNIQESWLRCHGLGFESSIFPLKNQPYSTYNSNGNNSLLFALDDFVFDTSDDIGEKYQTSAVYSPKQYRWFDIDGIGDLSTFSLNIVWYGKKTDPNERYQLYIAPDHLINVKFYFKPKSQLVCLHRGLTEKYKKEYEEEKIIKVKKIK